ncbi:Hpt domain-containing protein [uncultured Eubacterium sp.]|uniref:Hpt domain-containing protein n=1 Tax=uncultured Eubacterium sp. TaxID=165185 RepID=UPI0025E498F2|nr:Hpt domain-containing protein [uncultured Eubacterium sp.]MCI6536712.1 Hpt domain-containing protein [Lachnospiraceae bacterium]
MDIRECYQKMGGDFEDVMRRLGSENFIRRFVIRFLDDTSFQMIKEGIASKDAELAFRGAHTLKGVCSNLGFSKLCDLSSQLTEILRGRELKGYESVLAEVEKQYQITVDAIRELDQ